MTQAQQIPFFLKRLFCGGNELSVQYISPCNWFIHLLISAVPQKTDGSQAWATNPTASAPHRPQPFMATNWRRMFPESVPFWAFFSLPAHPQPDGSCYLHFKLDSHLGSTDVLNCGQFTLMSSQLVVIVDV